MIATISKETLKEKKKREADGSNRPGPKPCMVYWTGKGGMLSITVTTYCQEELDTSERGVTQVPDRTLQAGQICDACTSSYRQYEATIQVLGAPRAPVPGTRP